MLVKRLKTAGVYWVEDQAAQMGAALAYYTLFSLAPLLVIVIAITGQVYGTEAASEQILRWVRQSLNEESAAAVQTLLENSRHLPEGLGPWLLGLGTLLFGAVGVFTQLRASLDRIWRIQPPPAQGVVAGLIKNHLLALLMVLLSSAFVLVLLAGSTMLNFLLRHGEKLLPGEHWGWRLVDFLVSALLIVLLFAFTYRFMSDGMVRYRHVWGGAVVGAVLFTLGKMVIGFYLAHSQVTSGFGAASSLVALLIWVYYSAQIFLFGAEVIRVRLNP
ncbi:MAG: YihY/virulence factor BrkB family protein [Gemmataceae bacterium]|nr:YihY/virulence factor BrkB family protein [Gemmataceae bacterium]